MAMRPRGTCASCGSRRAVHIPPGTDGEVRVVFSHRTPGSPDTCAGSGRPAVEWRTAPVVELVPALEPHRTQRALAS